MLICELVVEVLTMAAGIKGPQAPATEGAQLWGAESGASYNVDFGFSRSEFCCAATTYVSFKAVHITPFDGECAFLVLKSAPCSIQFRVRSFEV